MRKSLIMVMVLMLIVSVGAVGIAATKSVKVMVEVVDLTDAIMKEIKGVAVSVNFTFPEINSIALTIEEKNIPQLQAVSGVLGVYRDEVVSVEEGEKTWDLDIIDVEVVHNNTYTDVDGTGVYVAVLDTGLLPNWRDYFPEEKVATEYGVGFLNPQGNPNPGAWTGTHAHGTHVSSTVIGYYLYDLPIDGVAPGAKIIPVKVLNNNGTGYDSGVTAGIIYVANLRASGKIIEPIVINMSLGSSEPSGPELKAIQYAIEQGVIVVTSAGNEGEAGMGYPGGYDEVISVGAVGWTEMWLNGWRADVPEGDIRDQVYVADFSSRELPGQYLDVLAPGDWIVGPYTINGAAHPPQWAEQDQMGQYYYLSGTSMASPHVAGVAALMLEKNPYLTQIDIEDILKETALYIAPNSGIFVPDPWGGDTYFWGSDATGSGLIQVDEAVEAAVGY
ncbi:MAG: S8 family serine peptidase [Halanaerobiales bacterium]|nr:S8 family serine peptidase [Halanaerobiales bacterium]